ncbi:MAG: sel1 repeat family protein [Pseudomonadota bacterium]|nr:sel1 repeat family protein [Pseudomonadota bacterium]
MYATLIFDGRRGARAICGLLVLLLVTIPISLAGKDQARAQDGSLFEFFSVLPGKPQLNPSELGGLPPWADDMKKARVAYRDGNYEKALAHFEPAAARGNIVASWYLGNMYRLGRGVEASTLKSLEYYQDVADAFTPDQPDPDRLPIIIDALVRVADVYREGDAAEGVKPNFKAAYQLYTTAASYGHPSAHYAQGLMLLAGKGVKANPAKALRWLILAAKRRYAPAEAQLGELYWKGDVVKRDRTRALMWYLLATQSALPGENPAIFDRYHSMAAQAGDDQILEAETRARLWSEKYPVPAPSQGTWPEAGYDG